MAKACEGSVFRQKQTLPCKDNLQLLEQAQECALFSADDCIYLYHDQDISENWMSWL